MPCLVKSQSFQKHYGALGDQGIYAWHSQKLVSWQFSLLQFFKQNFIKPGGTPSIIPFNQWPFDKAGI